MALAKRIERGDFAAKTFLIEHNLRLVASLARRYQGHGLTLNELFDEGMLGLIRAAEKFDWRKGFTFSTYATLWIRQALQRGIEDKGRTIRLPVSRTKELKKLYQAERKLSAEILGSPSNAELAAALGWDVKHVEKLRSVSQQLTSLDLPVGDSDDTLLGDLLVDTNSPSPLEETLENLSIHRLHEILGLLPESQQLTLMWLFGLTEEGELSLAEIGRRLNVSTERVRHYRDKGLKWLKDNYGTELEMLFDQGLVDEPIVLAEGPAPTPLHLVASAEVIPLPTRKQTVEQQLRNLQNHFGYTPSYLDLLRAGFNLADIYEHWVNLQQALQSIGFPKGA